MIGRAIERATRGVQRLEHARPRHRRPGWGQTHQLGVDILEVLTHEIEVPLFVRAKRRAEAIPLATIGG
jgi:hypothetical protein